ncbi:MAG: hypothetical protein ACJAY2_003354, partial [Pseudomonadales bacterium]
AVQDVHAAYRIALNRALSASVGPQGADSQSFLEVWKDLDRDPLRVSWMDFES